MSRLREAPAAHHRNVVAAADFVELQCLFAGDGNYSACDAARAIARGEGDTDEAKLDIDEKCERLAESAFQ